MYILQVIVYTLQKGGMIGAVVADVVLPAPNKKMAVDQLREDQVLSEDSKILSIEIVEAVFVE